MELRDTDVGQVLLRHRRAVDVLAVNVVCVTDEGRAARALRVALLQLEELDFGRKLVKETHFGGEVNDKNV